MKNTAHQNTRSLLNQHRFNIKKKYGQNFLVDDNTIKKIIATAAVDKGSTVVEIGPGMGALSKELTQQCGALVAYEIDKDLIPVLKTLFKDDKNVAILHKDFLKSDLKKDLQSIDFAKKEVTVVANLPYYITTPILFRCLEFSDIIDKMVFMTQYEVAKRLTAQTNTKDYNALSVMVHYLTEATFEFKVSKNVFIPAPNVDSGIITLKVRKEREAKDETFFFDFVKTAFKQKRKTLLNNLSKGYDLPKETVSKLITDHGETANVRAEAISVNQFLKMSEAFLKLL